MEKESFSAGLLTIRLYIGEARSLKDKRRVLKSLKDGVRNRFNASVAEVARQDSWKSAVLGIVVAGNDGKRINSVLSRIVEYVGRSAGVALTDYEIEIV